MDPSEWWRDEEEEKEGGDENSTAFAALTAWIERERLLVDDREDVEGIDFSRMDAKAVAPLPHIFASFFARRPYKRKAGHYPKWNGFYLLLYRDAEEGWKLERIRKNSSYAQFVPVFAARSKAVQEIKTTMKSTEPHIDDFWIKSSVADVNAG